jgi:hypothetical protein
MEKLMQQTTERQWTFLIYERGYPILWLRRNASRRLPPTLAATKFAPTPLMPVCTNKDDDPARKSRGSDDELNGSAAHREHPVASVRRPLTDDVSREKVGDEGKSKERELEASRAAARMLTEEEKTRGWHGPGLPSRIDCLT